MQRGGLWLHFDGDLRHEAQRFDFESANAGNVLHGGADLSGVGAQCVEIRTEDAHDNAGAGSGEHFFDSLAQKRQQITREAGIAIDNGLGFVNCFVVVHVGVEADPEFGEVGADDFIGDLGTANVRALIAHAWHGHEIMRGGDGDARRRAPRAGPAGGGHRRGGLRSTGAGFTGATTGSRTGAS